MTLKAKTNKRLAKRSQEVTIIVQKNFDKS